MTVACQQTSQEKVQTRLEVVGDRYSVGQHVNKKCIGIDAVEAGALSQLLEQDHAQAPPVRGSRNPACDGFGCHVAAGFQWRHDVQVELG
ncbi:hypothetical protein D3C76_1327960 [compost metagenome]